MVKHSPAAAQHNRAEHSNGDATLHIVKQRYGVVTSGTAMQWCRDAGQSSAKARYGGVAFSQAKAR